MNPDSNIGEQPGGEGNNDPYIQDGVVIEFSENDELKTVLLNILDWLRQGPDYDMPSIPLEYQIDIIKSGSVQPLLVDIDSSDYYFICAYFNCNQHEDENDEYNCASEYTWVKYENENAIKDSFESKAFIEAFQINRASITKDIITGDSKSRLAEQVNVYWPEFRGGVNVSPADFSNRTFIFLNKSQGDTVYHSLLINDEFYAIDCICLDDEYYIPIETHSENANGELFDSTTFEWELGEYYDALTKIMITGKYSRKSNQTNETTYYGLFDIDQFVDKIIEK